MKKKLLGMILTFVVMMIIPLAVSAANAPQLQLSNPSYSGLSYTSGKGTAVNAQVAVDGTINLSVVDLPTSTADVTVSDVTVEFNKGGDDYIHYEEKTNAIIIRGNDIGTATVKVTVEWNEKAKDAATATAKEANLTCTVNVVAKAIVDFTVNGEVTSIKDGKPYNYNLTMADNTDLYVGDVFTVTGGTAKFNSGESKSVDADEFAPISVVFVAGQKYVAFDLATDDPNSPKRSERHSFTETYKVSIVEREYDVRVEANPNYKGDFVKVYHEGDKFIFESIRLAVYYKNTTQLHTYAYYNEASGFTANAITMSVFNDELTVKYNNKSETFSFKNDLGITTVSKKTVVPKLIPDAQDEYVVGKEFAFDDLCLEVTDEGSTNKYYTVYYDGGKGFQIDSSSVGYKFIMSTADKKNIIKVIFDSKTYTIDLEADLGITVYSNHKLVGLKSVGTPVKTNYTEGQIVDDWGGIKFYAIYETVDANGKTQKHEELIPTSKYSYLDIKPFEYSAVYTDVNTYAMVSYTEGNYTTPYIKVFGFNVSPKQVSGIEVHTPPKKTSYEKNDVLSLEGMKIKVLYNNGTSEIHSYDDPNFACSPKHGDVLSATTTSVMIVYKDKDVTVETTWDGLQVNSAVKIKRASISVKPAKMTYEVGEKFDPTGIEVTLIYDDDNFADEILTVDNNRYLREYSKTFKSLKDTTVTFTIPNPHNAKDSKAVDLVVTVKEKVVPTSIENVTYRKTYLAGEYASIEKDITDFTVIMSDGSKLEKADVDKLVEAKSATLKFTSTDKLKTSTKKLTLSFTFKGTTVTKDLTIEVKEPVCILETAGSTASVTPYESFELALEAANALSTTEAKKVTITLGQDVELSEKYQFNAERSIGIDLNGHNLTMAQNQMIVPHKTSYKNVTITLLNSSSTDATIMYDKEDKDMWIVLGKGDELVITWETEIPGIYEITLTAGEGGKISGPTEVAHGNDAKYTITPDKGYEIAEVFVDKVSKGKGETVTLLSVDEEHEIVVAFQEVVVEWQNPFKDVYKSAGYYKAIQFVYENNLFKGVSANEFEPNETMTRAMFVTVLGRLYGISENDSRYAGKTSFSDVKISAATNWYVPYVEWASQSGLLLGYEDGTFRPDNEISHTEMYILMERYARMILGVSASATNTRVTVSDEKDIPTWEGAYEAVQFATKYDFLVKTGTKIYPNSDAKRHELASLLLNFCDSFGLMEDEK